MKSPFLFGALMAALACTSVQAAAPMVKTQPGYYRMMLGDFEITALSDGAIEFPVELLTNTTPDEIAKALSYNYLGSRFEVSVNAFLVNTGAKLVLVDTGAGRTFGAALGKLSTSLKAAGYLPEQVDEVYITHMHADHVGGLLDGDKRAFPNAVVRADQREGDYWLRAENGEKAPDDTKVHFRVARASIDPYAKAGKFKPFNGDTELLPGIKAIASHGHTPGHSFYAIESNGQKLVLWGDLTHVAAVQFRAPATTQKGDTDSKAAAAERQKAYADAARNGYLIAGAHLSFPGIGRLREGKGYEWIPVNYALPR